MSTALHHPDFTNHLAFNAQSAQAMKKQPLSNNMRTTTDQRSDDGSSAKNAARWWQKTKLKEENELVEHKYYYEIDVDVSDYKPSEIEVRLDGSQIVIVGRHEDENSADICVAHEFIRRYSLPGDVDREKVISALSRGMLKIEAPKIDS